MKVTATDSVLNIGAITIRIPAGTPVDLLANINVFARLSEGAVHASIYRFMPAYTE